MSLLPGDEMEEPNLATELAEEVELLKKFARRSRQRIWKLSRQAGTILGQDGDITKLLNLLDEILSLPFTDVLTVAKPEEALQTTISYPVGDHPRNDSHVDDGGVEVDEEMCASPIPEDDENHNDDHLCNGNQENSGTTEEANLDYGRESMQPPFLTISNYRSLVDSTQFKKSESPTCSKTVSNEKSLNLDTKEKSDKNPPSLPSQTKTHRTTRANNNCSICHQVFFKSSDLRNHLKTVHRQKKRRPRFPCRFPGCAKTYMTNHSVLRHVRIEHTENSVRYPCTLCSKKFKTRQYLDIHIRTHTSEKPYKCATCGRSFSQMKNLTRHEETHLEECDRKIFQCHLCPSTFSQRNNLQHHVRVIHENRRNFPCTFCDKRFSRPSHLKDHLEAKHCAKQEPSHFCDQCEFKTHSKYYLAKHKKQHGPEQHECYFCGKKFVAFWELVQHCGRHHTLEKKCNLEFE